MRSFCFSLLMAGVLLSGCGAAQASSSSFYALALPADQHLRSQVRSWNEPEFQRAHADLMRAWLSMSEMRASPYPQGLPDSAFLNDPALQAVTNEFGPSEIDLSALPLRSAIADSGVKPWSSWWFPAIDNELFVEADLDRPQSALGKYDSVRKRNWELAEERGRVPESAAQYEATHFKAGAAKWEGLCDAWAFASILQPEPKRAVTIRQRAGLFSQDETTFSVADLKGLLLKTYEGVLSDGLKYYGQKFTGGFDGWIHPDIYPDQFHRFVEIELFKRKKAFVMDYDPGVEVWNVPVYKANYIIQALPDQPDAVYVRMWLYTVASSDANHKDFVGSKEVLREYHYVLTGERTREGKLRVKAGYWVKSPNGVDSRQDHPDYLVSIVEPSKVLRKSLNPHLDVRMVDELISQSIR